METVTNFISLGSRITADGDCSHEIKRCLLLGRKALTNLDSILKSRDIILPTNIYLIKAVAFSVSYTDVRVGPYRRQCSIQSCPTLCNPKDCSPPGSSVLGDSPGKNTEVGCHALLQEIFPTQGLNPGLLHCRWIPYLLSHQGIPKKAECWRTDTFELWSWRRLLRVPWTWNRSNQSILKEITPKYSLEGLLLKLKLQYFAHLMQRANSLEKTLKIEGKDWRREEKRTTEDEVVEWHHQLHGHEFE